MRLSPEEKELIREALSTLELHHMGNVPESDPAGDTEDWKQYHAKMEQIQQLLHRF